MGRGDKMTNRENMKKTITKDFDKKQNYNIIINKIENKHNLVYLKYAIMPMIIILIISFFLVNSQKEKEIETFRSIENVNTTSFSHNDEDYSGMNINTSASTVIINELDEFKQKRYDSKNYIDNINIPYFEVLNSIKIPKDFDVFAEGRGVCITKDVKNKDYGKINNYELLYKNSKNNRSITIALSDKNMPYRDFTINKDNSKKTLINGIEVEIFRYKNIYVSIFNYNGYNFDIESCDIIEEEYIRLLYSLIK